MRDLPRADRVADVQRLLPGRTQKQVADLMGVSYGYVRDLLYDPTGEKAAARKLRYRGVCEECGGPTDGSNGRASAPKICRACFIVKHAAQHGTRSKYDAGCRCEDCREAAAICHRALIGKPPPSHGLSGYRNYGCRCDVCREAASRDNWLRGDYRRQWAAKKAAA